MNQNSIQIATRERDIPNSGSVHRKCTVQVVLDWIDNVVRRSVYY